MRHPREGFTLIELLIVVAIIAILAAIAVPNFLEAQTRSKISRVRADLRSLATAIESYVIDWNRYPLTRGPNASFPTTPNNLTDGWGNQRGYGWRTVPIELSTPVAYITSTAIPDPFKTGKSDINLGGPSDGRPWNSMDPTDAGFCYHNIWEFVNTPGAGFPPDDLVDYGQWRLFSLGPVCRYPNNAIDGNAFGSSGFGWVYDPTNGTVSRGAIIRTQADTQGARLQTPD